MEFPVYSEISNYSKVDFPKKNYFSLSILFITDNLSSSIETLNSVYNCISTSKTPYELIIINLDKISYNYDTIFSTFPFVRILFPQDNANLVHLFKLGINEAHSKNILLLNREFTIVNFNLDILNIYLSESSFGIIIPLIFNEKEDIIPGITKMEIKKGLLKTFSMDIKGTAISSLYPKYPCFIINKNAFLSNPDLSNYNDEKYFLLELGYRIWKSGFIITQARNFKVNYYGKEYEDIDTNEELDYIIFNIRNINFKKLVKGRWLILFRIILRKLISFDINYISKLILTLKEMKKNRHYAPIEDSAILTIINKDMP